MEKDLKRERAILDKGYAAVRTVARDMVICSLLFSKCSAKSAGVSSVEWGGTSHYLRVAKQPKRNHARSPSNE